MKNDWRMQWGFSLLGRVPTRLPWRLASWMGRDPAPQQQATANFLISKFAQAFPGRELSIYKEWARLHLNMLAQEMLDGAALSRLGMQGGVAIDIQGLEHARELQKNGHGFILVLNHFDRLLGSPIGLARQGVHLQTMTMPIADNEELQGAHRSYMLRKINSYIEITGGQWLASNQGMRPLYDGLKSGQAWVILGDVWSPEFGRLRAHPFLGGYLSVPTGIERIAQSCKVPLLHGITYSEGPACLRVVIEPTPPDPEAAMNAVIQRLEQDVRQRPWAWWQWGVWDQMWSPTSAQA